MAGFIDDVKREVNAVSASVLNPQPALDASVARIAGALERIAASLETGSVSPAPAAPAKKPDAAR